MVHKSIYFILIVILLSPLLMWVGWFLTPKKKLVVALVDKTVLTPKGQEHISLNWILNHHRYTKTSVRPYEIDHDYFGFFPLKNENYDLKGLEQFSNEQLKKLSIDADLVYFTDTYGISKVDWFKTHEIGTLSGMLYGGLSNQDITFLTAMKQRQKLILAEFNTFGSPTYIDNRKAFEELFGLEWTGWSGRYFHNLDKNTNPELPQWLINNYKKSHDGEWAFTKSGIAFVNDREQVVILEEDTHLSQSLPFIQTTVYAQQKWHLPKNIKYSFWFDVIKPDSSINKVNATYKLDLLSKGKKELAKYNIPETFPAIMSHVDDDYRFYYFSGDFSDNPVRINTSYFKGIGFFKSLFYDESDPLERSSFFWKFYRPMLSQILEDEKQWLRPD